MRLPFDILSFLAEPVTIILATRGEGFTPEIARGVGVTAAADGVEVLISGWQWPATVANLRANGALAMTVSAPQTYRTYQIKGQAGLRAATEQDDAIAADYSERMLAMFEGLSLDRAFTGKWLCRRDLVVARLAVAEAFVQTPGPQAGLPIGTIT